jgi:glycosyltransferase involved in cell wall biosynthesis
MGKPKFSKTLISALDQARIPVWQLASDHRFDRALIFQVRNTICGGNFDVVHTHGYKADIFGYFAGRLLGVPLVATAHGWTRGSASLRFYAKLDLRVLRRFNRVVAVSGTLAKELSAQRIARDTLTTITNGIDWERFRDARPAKLDLLPPDTEQIVGMVGRLVPEKGFQFMVEAARRIIAVKPRTSFLVIGEGPYRESLERLAAASGVIARFYFSGHSGNMPGLYKRMNMMVLPSLREGTPMCVLEAMSAGVPVVATAVGGMPALITDGGNGRLIEAQSAEALQNAVLELLLNPNYAAVLAANAESSVRERFSSRVMASRYGAVYDRILPESPYEEQPKHDDVSSIHLSRL